MGFTIAIQPDDYGPGDAASPIWTHLLKELGHEVRQVNVYRSDILDQLAGCQGFMWRFAHFPNLLQIARRVLPVVEREMGMVVYPDQNTCWHYDDKIAQSYIFHAKDIPTPKTWVWYSAKLARNWARSADYPVVLKLRGGAASQNVRLVHSYEEAEQFINALFGNGVNHMANLSPKQPWGMQRIRSTAKLLLTGIPPSLRQKGHSWELHKNYVLFQEFLSPNPFDTRITVIGNRAFGFRRFNRDNDFRASGSGKIDFDNNAIDPRFVRLAFKTARAIGSQSCAMDGLLRNDEPVVGEISYTFVSKYVHQCPGHWTLLGDPANGDLVWKQGRLRPEVAQVADFLVRLESHNKAQP